MPNAWIEKLKVFNAGGDVWAIPRKDTVEREMLNKGQRFTYKLPSIEPKPVEVVKPVEVPKPKPVEVVKPMEVNDETKIKNMIKEEEKKLRELRDTYNDKYNVRVKNIHYPLSEEEYTDLRKKMDTLPTPKTKEEITQYKRQVTKISKSFEDIIYKREVEQINKRAVHQNKIKDLELQLEEAKPADIKLKETLTKYKELIKDSEDNFKQNKKMGFVKADKEYEPNPVIQKYIDFVKEHEPTPEPKKEEPKLEKNYDKDAELIKKEVDKTGNWREKLNYTAPTYLENGSLTHHHNHYSQVPKGIPPEAGFRWLNNKYGDIYKKAVDKVKQIAEDKVDVANMTPSQRKAFRHLDFKDSKQMNEFFEDTKFADPIISDYLHHNLGKKGVSFRRPIAELKKYLNIK